jgi:hypothetical protein
MTKEYIQAIGNFLSTYHTDLNYIRNFQRFKHDKISATDFLQKRNGTFYAFLIEFRIIRNISQGSADRLLKETMSWVNDKNAGNVDLFAKKLSKTNLTRGHVVTSMASKVLFLNNPWSIMPMDALARKALKQRENNYSVYTNNIATYRKENKLVLKKFLEYTKPLTSIVDAEFKKELSDIKTICENRAVDKLLWTRGR